MTRVKTPANARSVRELLTSTRSKLPDCRVNIIFIDSIIFPSTCVLLFALYGEIQIVVYRSSANNTWKMLIPAQLKVQIGRLNIFFRFFDNSIDLCIFVHVVR